MRAVPHALAVRALAYFSVRDLIPLYAVYALLFADHGLSTGEISSLFVIWSVTAFAAEVPSGAWADTVPRRRLLALSSLIYAAGFATWIVAPGYAGFATGFVLWALSGALMSGTYEAYLYDELAALGAATSYPRLLGFAHSLAMVCNLVATISAAPLMALGGYAFVGWVSVAVALVQFGVALTLPAAPRVASARGRSDEGVGRRYVHMLVSGLREVRRVRTVRNGVLLVALLLGTTAYDEYFPLVALNKGTEPAGVPILIALVVAGQAIGTALAGRTARIGARTMAVLVAIAGGLLVTGALIAQPLAFVAIGIGYGAVNNAIIVAEARLQDAIEGSARATVTSVAGLSSELAAVAIFATFGALSTRLSESASFGVVCGLVVVVAAVTPQWLPRPPTYVPERVEEA
ncbi:MFS transporter [Solicola gregarius]|uniref:MFS transporter n=1 Tax=Solicola gregarius TaxID=2908642 RepID=A0AA46TFH3_9ACTN|nr:MFS transporter [Solicola gregarius]UYM03904.1 MFS transporter [Solicola gregarius]